MEPLRVLRTPTSFACPCWLDVQLNKHIYRRETSTPFLHRLTQENRPAMFSWRALVLNRYSYHVLPERLPRASRPAGSIVTNQRVSTYARIIRLPRLRTLLLGQRADASCLRLKERPRWFPQRRTPDICNATSLGQKWFRGRRGNALQGSCQVGATNNLQSNTKTK